MQTYVLKMIPGVGFNQDSSGNLLIRYHSQQDLARIINGFQEALEELEKIEVQPVPNIPIARNPMLNINPVAAIGAATAQMAVHGNVAPLPAGHMMPTILPPEQMKPAMMPPGHQMPSVQQIIHRPILRQPAPDPIASNNGVKVVEGFEPSDE